MPAGIPAHALGQQGQPGFPAAVGDLPCPALQPGSQLKTSNFAAKSDVPCLGSVSLFASDFSNAIHCVRITGSHSYTSPTLSLAASYAAQFAAWQPATQPE